ncbi:MAG: hypothetical protein KC544_13625 [Gemmatimonadetes bacterium]|nr:hypothetical protein [Gemmatimonadota bacterium]MCB9505914.1 hypothetical protein [Gemmatimonadales bacterium]MCA9764155.1 hypothetical protein [Gemmatimonadota bacterium]MCA9769251.1 hypothetical protein [Gemmatimonadota bacterium]MCB9518864.1 hypothetical protein [Gemmatimonadales bacterium]
MKPAAALATALLVPSACAAQRAHGGGEAMVALQSMATARAAHTATALPDGRVLLVGGFGDDQGAPPVVEVFDPVRQRFTALESRLEPRHSHTATPLADGRILVTGGYGRGNRYLATTVLIDPRTGQATAGPDMLEARAGHEAVRLDDGRVLVIGGVGVGWTFLASAELYDPVANRFLPTGAMAEPRESHVALRLHDGRVAVIGGHVGRREALRLQASIEVHDPATGRFTMLGVLREARHKHDAVVLPDGDLLVLGGADRRDSRGVLRSVERIDPASGRSSPMPALARPRYKLRGTSIVLPDGRILVAGGASRPEIYAPWSGASLVLEGPDRLPGLFSAAALLADGSVLVSGGYGPAPDAGAGAWRIRP